MDWGWTIGTVLAALAVAYGALAVQHTRSARLLFVSAAAIICYKIIEWGLSTQVHSYLRIIGVALLGASTTVGLVELWRSTLDPNPKPSSAFTQVQDTLQPSNATSTRISKTPSAAAKHLINNKPAVTRSLTNPGERQSIADQSSAHPNPSTLPEDQVISRLRERTDILRQLTNLYMLTHDGISSRMMAGMELPPANFLNAELERQGANWRVKEVVDAKAHIVDLP